MKPGVTSVPYFLLLIDKEDELGNSWRCASWSPDLWQSFLIHKIRSPHHLNGRRECEWPIIELTLSGPPPTDLTVVSQPDSLRRCSEYCIYPYL